jgi:cobalt-zinc-cadmium efflux system protein
MEHGGHNHQHHSRAIAVEGHQKVFIIGIVINIAFVLAEAIAGLIYNSMALLTDAGHNLSDVASLALSLAAFRMAGKKSNRKFTYGYKKATVLAALLNAIILLVAIGVLGYESARRLFRPERVNGDVIAWVAALGIVINGFTAFLFFKSRKKELNAKSAYLHMLADALVSLGVVAAGVVMTYTQWWWLDPVIGLIIMIVILVSTWHLLTDSLKMSLDAVPANIDLQKIKEVILRVGGVKAAGHIHIWAMSTTENALTAHVVADEQYTFDEKLQLIDRIKHELLHHNIHHATIELKRKPDY